MQESKIEPQIFYFSNLTIWINPNIDASIAPVEIKKMVYHILQDTDFYFNKKKPIKNDVATTLVEITLAEKRMVIKRINARNFFIMIRRLFRLSRVEKNWKYAQLLTRYNIDSFTPIMLVKKKYFGFCYVSYLYMSKIEGVEAIDYFYQCPSKLQWQFMADQIIALIHKLNHFGLRHRDLNLSNMIIFDNKPYLIDLDAMKQDKNKKKHKKEIEKFIKNIAYLKESNINLFDYFREKLIN